jgi:hypothetical protein
MRELHGLFSFRLPLKELNALVYIRKSHSYEPRFLTPEGLPYLRDSRGNLWDGHKSAMGERDYRGGKEIVIDLHRTPEIISTIRSSGFDPVINSVGLKQIFREINFERDRIPDFGFDLWTHQDEVVRDCMNYFGNMKKPKSYMFVIPTGGGKTNVFIELSRRFQNAGIQKHLFLVPKRVILRQFQRKLSEYFDREVGIIGDNHHEPTYDLDVCTYQSLARYMPDRVAHIPGHASKVRNSSSFSFNQEYGVLFCDECHGIGAKTFLSAVRSMGFHRIGGTATAFRHDGEERLVFMALNKPRKVFLNRDLRDIKNTSGDACYGYININPVWSESFGNETFVKASRIIKKTEGPTILIHTNKTPLAGFIRSLDNDFLNVRQSIMKKRGWKEHLRGSVESDPSKISYMYMDGATTGRLRDRTLEAHSEELFRVLITTDILGEGYDPKNLLVLIFLTVTRSKRLIYQWHGRGSRARKNNVPCDIFPFLYEDEMDLADDYLNIVSAEPTWLRRDYHGTDY